MKFATFYSVPGLIFAASAASAQPATSAHDKHQPSTQSQAGGAERCCCEEMMHKMMSQMMQKHQGTSSSKTNADQHGSQADQHQHDQ